MLILVALQGEFFLHVFDRRHHCHHQRCRSTLQLTRLTLKETHASATAGRLFENIQLNIAV